MEQRYFVSKLLGLFFARELARHINPDTGPIVVSVTPGLCSSDLDIESTTSPIMRNIGCVVMPFITRTPEMGSRAIIHAAVNTEIQVQHGKYLANCRIEKESDYALGAEGMSVQGRLWDETMQILQSVDSRSCGTEKDREMGGGNAPSDSFERTYNAVKIWNQSEILGKEHRAVTSPPCPEISSSNGQSGVVTMKQRTDIRLYRRWSAPEIWRTYSNAGAMMEQDRIVPLGRFQKY
ncbi:hypothetical protein B0H17DRAFT_1131807 [Mycena rosella]|uniref:Uncharacterized protein n=1 Tax=Mycena rosella TaxID=1033263 RepID=A0AAD7DQ41_MYCRO|nr:hypothetical protein B0H17DRAFT_1131807 [Mycena rosella]